MDNFTKGGRQMLQPDTTYRIQSKEELYRFLWECEREHMTWSHTGRSVGASGNSFTRSLIEEELEERRRVFMGITSDGNFLLWKIGAFYEQWEDYTPSVSIDTVEL